MRSRRSGTIVNVSSIAAKDPLPTSALYAASKAALEGMSESLAKEVEPFGVTVLIVNPGAFRTNFLSAMVVSEKSCPAEYQDGPVGKVLGMFSSMAGKQPGDPAKAVERIFEIVTGEGEAGHLKGNVLRLVLGEDALGRMRRTNDKLLQDLEAQEAITKSTNFLE